MSAQGTIQSEWIRESAGNMPNTTAQHVANRLSDLVAQMIANSAAPRIKDAPIQQAKEQAAGVYLLLEDGLPGQTIMILPQDSAPNIVDFMLEHQPGTCVYLGDVA